MPDTTHATNPDGSPIPNPGEYLVTAIVGGEKRYTLLPYGTYHPGCEGCVDSRAQHRHEPGAVYRGEAPATEKRRRR